MEFCKKNIFKSVLVVNLLKCVENFLFTKIYFKCQLQITEYDLVRVLFPVCSTKWDIENDNQELSSTLADVFEVLAAEAIEDALLLEPPRPSHGGEHSDEHTDVAHRTVGIEEQSSRPVDLVQITVGIHDICVVGEGLVGIRQLNGVVGHEKSEPVVDNDDGLEDGGFGSGHTDIARRDHLEALDEAVRELLEDLELVGQIEHIGGPDV